MSIVTRTGDQGSTGLMYGRRVPKHHPRVKAYGTVDELNSALGLARAITAHPFVRDVVLPIQKDLVILMGEMATAPEDRDRYVKDGFSLVTSDMTRRLEQRVAEIEAQNITLKGWATPGATQDAAALDLARAVCRRGERRASALQEAGELHNPEILVYFNRLADLLWLMARWVETRSAGESAATS